MMLSDIKRAYRIDILRIEKIIHPYFTVDDALMLAVYHLSLIHI